MKKLVALIFIFISIQAKAQKLISFRNSSGKYGFKDAKEQVIVQPKYDTVILLQDDIAAVRIGLEKSNANWGFVNGKGAEITPIKYADEHYKEYIIHEGLIKVAIKTKSSNNNEDEFKWGFIDINGKEIIACKYDWVKDFDNGLAIIKQKYDWGLIDKTGKIIIAPKYINIFPFKNNYAIVLTNNNKYGVINKVGKEIIPATYSIVSFDGFCNGLISVKKDFAYGFLDSTGKVIIPFEYSYALSFSEGLAAVQKVDKWGFIDNKGKMVIAPIFDWVEASFKSGKAAVRINDETFFIDRKGVKLK